MEKATKEELHEPARQPIPAATGACTEVLGQLARFADHLLESHHISILLLGARRPRPYVVAAPGLPVPYTRSLDAAWRRAQGWNLAEMPADLSPFDRLLAGEKVLVLDMETAPLPAIPIEAARAARIRSLVAEPLFGAEDRVHGAVLFHGTEPGPHRRRDRELFSVLTTLASITILRQFGDARADSGEEGFRRRADPISVSFWAREVGTGDLMFLSPSFESVWGISDFTFRSTPESRLNRVHPDDRPRIARAFDRAHDSGWMDETFRSPRPDGSTRWLRERVFPVHGDDRELQCVVGITEDITTGRESSARTRESEQSFRQMAENLGVVFWLTNWLEKRVLYVSPGWESIWGQSVDCLYSDNLGAWADNIHPEDRDRVLARFRDQAEGGSYDEDFRVLHPDGSVHWLHERAYPIHDEHGAVYRMAGIAEDITERKEVELKLARARDEIENLRRNEVHALTSELLFAEENERRRLAQGLHDGMNQIITLALLKLAQLGDRCPAAERELTQEIEGLLEEAGRATRALTYELSPPILHDLGFEPALEWLSEHVQERYGVAVSLQIDPLPGPLGPRLLVLLFRAVRELFAYVVEVSKSPWVRLRLSHDRDSLRLTIESGGTPLEDNQERRGGLSLSAIGQRLEHLGGRMRVRPAPEDGTLIEIESPLLPTPLSSP